MRRVPATLLTRRTLHYVMTNIAHLCSREKSRVWGKDGWKKVRWRDSTALIVQVVVCIIADGRQAIHPRVLDCLSALGVYQDGVAKNVVEQQGVEKVVGAHIYEFTTQYSINPELKFKGLEKGIMPTQIVFCLKGPSIGVMACATARRPDAALATSSVYASR